MLCYICTSIVLISQEEKEKLEEAIEKNDTDLIQHMFQGNNIDINANISEVRSYTLLISCYRVCAQLATYLYIHYGG